MIGKVIIKVVMAANTAKAQRPITSNTHGHTIATKIIKEVIISAFMAILCGSSVLAFSYRVALRFLGQNVPRPVRDTPLNV